jgi:hypothetical protein
MTCMALKHKALDTSQYALPGSTSNRAVWNKLLFLDLAQQTLTLGCMADYDATVAFDHILSGLSIITCRCIALPLNACHFMYHLLNDMEFHLITGYGTSTKSFKNNQDPQQIGQGILQGSSSAAPIYMATSDVCLTAYNKCGTGAQFIHHITGHAIRDNVAQYVDHNTQQLNSMGASIPLSTHPKEVKHLLLEAANTNTNIWSKLLWISCGTLNPEKCFYYYLDPTFKYKTSKVDFKPLEITYGTISLIDPGDGSICPLEKIHANTACRTLGVHLSPTGTQKPK